MRLGSKILERGAFLGVMTLKLGQRRVRRGNRSLMLIYPWVKKKKSWNSRKRGCSANNDEDGQNWRHRKSNKEKATDLITTKLREVCNCNTCWDTGNLCNLIPRVSPLTIPYLVPRALTLPCWSWKRGWLSVRGVLWDWQWVDRFENARKCLWRGMISLTFSDIRDMPVRFCSHNSFLTIPVFFRHHYTCLIAKRTKTMI